MKNMGIVLEFMRRSKSEDKLTGGIERTEATKTSWNYLWVKDKAGNEYACPIDALKKPDEISDDEKNGCVDDATEGPVGD